MMTNHVSREVIEAEAKYPTRLPAIVEDRGASVFITWYRVMVMRDMHYPSTGDIPEGTLGWAHATHPRWWSFVTELDDRFTFAALETDLDIMPDTFVQQTYVLPERYWATRVEEQQ